MLHALQTIFGAPNINIYTKLRNFVHINVLGCPNLLPIFGSVLPICTRPVNVRLLHSFRYNPRLLLVPVRVVLYAGPRGVEVTLALDVVERVAPAT